jgi:hypothetical protein
MDYIDAHNEDCAPFRWTKTADEILDKIREFGERTMQLHGDGGVSPVINDPAD